MALNGSVMLSIGGGSPGPPKAMAAASVPSSSPATRGRVMRSLRMVSCRVEESMAPVSAAGGGQARVARRNDGCCDEMRSPVRQAQRRPRRPTCP